MRNLLTHTVLDAKGLACPMPIVKTKKMMNELAPGEVLQVQATDRGSKADIEAWAKSAGHYFLGTIEEGNVLNHYLRKASEDEVIEKKHPNVITNENLQAKLAAGEKLVIVDVRESAEYAFSHIPNAQSIPLGELDERTNELEVNKEIFVVCRTGNRSDLAAQKLTQKGFKQVFNVVPGMSEWNGPTDSDVYK